MNTLEKVKVRLGILYTDPVKDAEIAQIIDAAKIYFAGAGWEIGPAPDAMAIEAITLFCKMAQSTDPAALTNHPVMRSFIVQGRLASDSV